MLAELANKIEELVKGQVEPAIEEINGVEYEKTARGYSLLKKTHTKYIEVNSLDGLVGMIDAYLNETKDTDIKAPFIVNIDFNNIQVMSALGNDKIRNYLIEANPMIPNLEMGHRLTVEELIILLSTSYVPTENTTKFINSLSSLRVVEEVEFNDDGIGQTVVAKQGASMNKSFQVQPIVKLQPIRSYAEIEQIESKFLFRVNKDGTVCLRDADGGQWKYEVQKRIFDYLKEKLNDLIENDLVRLIG